MKVLYAGPGADVRVLIATGEDASGNNVDGDDARATILELAAAATIDGGKAVQVDVRLTPCVESTLVFQGFNSLKLLLEITPIQAVGWFANINPRAPTRRSELAGGHRVHGAPRRHTVIGRRDIAGDDEGRRRRRRCFGDGDARSQAPRAATLGGGGATCQGG